MHTSHSKGESKPGVPLKSRIRERWAALKSERTPKIDQWREISKFLMPTTGRFLVSDRNKGGKKTNAIYDNTATYALRILGAGMMAGASSPARQWFKLETADQDLNRHAPVKIWLESVSQLMMTIFNRSNTYRMLHNCYEELAGYGTYANVILPNYDTVIHNYGLTAGEYCIATDPEGKVNTLYREFQKTVAEVVREFGIENVSRQTRLLHEKGTLQAPVNILHAIEPRFDRDPTKLDNKNMAYGSYYMEEGAEQEHEWLRISGFKTFPCMVPRWSSSGGDVYGNSPGSDTIGDIKQLMHQQLRKGQGIDYQTNPPLQVPVGVSAVDRLPGGITNTTAAGPQSTIRTAFDVNLDLSHLTADINDVRQRINRGFYSDLFLMLANATDTRMTATEVAERHEEKLLMLGPVMERLHNEALEPLITVTFEAMSNAGILPDAPEELNDMELSIVFVSMLAQAQRTVGLNSVDRLVSSIGVVSQIKPEVMDKFNADAWLDDYSSTLGTSPRLINSTDDAMRVRQARAEAQQQQQQLDAAQQAAAATKDLGAAGLGEQ
mgnify:CR=1 FL=1